LGLIGQTHVSRFKLLYQNTTFILVLLVNKERYFRGKWSPHSSQQVRSQLDAKAKKERW